MNLSLITQNIEAQTKAGEQAKRFQTVLAAFDKVCSDNKFKSYSDFLAQIAVFEGTAVPSRQATKRGEKKAGRPKKSSGKARGQGYKIADDVRAAIVRDLKTGKMTTAEIARAHGVSRPSVSNIKDEEGLTKKRKSKKLPAVADLAASTVATPSSPGSATPTA